MMKKGIAGGNIPTCVLGSYYNDKLRLNPRYLKNVYKLVKGCVPDNITDASSDNINTFS